MSDDRDVVVEALAREWDAEPGKDIQAWDLVEVHPGDCDYWGHQSSRWASEGAHGMVEGTWRGHPGGDGDHHIAVGFSDRGMYVASLIYSESELKLVRRGKYRRPLTPVTQEPRERVGLEGA